MASRDSQGASSIEGGEGAGPNHVSTSRGHTTGGDHPEGQLSYQPSAANTAEFERVLQSDVSDTFQQISFCVRLTLNSDWTSYLACAPQAEHRFGTSMRSCVLHLRRAEVL